MLSLTFIEWLALAAALATSIAVRPWRLLAYGSQYDLLPPLITGLIVLPCLWWWPGSHVSPLLSLLGMNLVLLTLGWPLAVLVAVWAGACGVAMGYTSIPGAITEVVWHGLLPATLALGAGFVLRRVFGPHVVVYLLGRGFLVPLAVTFASGLVAHTLLGKFDALGADAVPAMVLVAMAEAMLTGVLVTLLVAEEPRCLATWSDRLFLLRDRPRRLPQP